MKRAACMLSTVMVLTIVCLGRAMAQSAPRIDRLTPSQLQTLSRDLVPSNAQDFFRAGQVKLVQEARSLSRPRSRSNENLLNVKPSPQRQPVELQQPASPRDQTK